MTMTDKQVQQYYSDNAASWNKLFRLQLDPPVGSILQTIKWWLRGKR